MHAKVKDEIILICSERELVLLRDHSVATLRLDEEHAHDNVNAMTGLHRLS